MFPCLWPKAVRGLVIHYPFLHRVPLDEAKRWSLGVSLTSWGEGSRQQFLVPQGPCLHLCLSSILTMVLLLLVLGSVGYILPKKWWSIGFLFHILRWGRDQAFLYVQAPPRESDYLALAQSCALNYQTFNFAEGPYPISSHILFSYGRVTIGPFLYRVLLDEEAMISQVFSHISKATIPLTTSGNWVPQTEKTGITVLPRISPSLEKFRRDLSNRSEVPFILVCLKAQLSTTNI